MNRETILALAEHLRQSITFTEGPRVGRLLPQSFRSEGCDHTLAKTTDWLTANGHDVNAAVRWLKERGGTCDCKVITNVVRTLDAEI